MDRIIAQIYRGPHGLWQPDGYKKAWHSSPHWVYETHSLFLLPYTTLPALTKREIDLCLQLSLKFQLSVFYSANTWCLVMAPGVSLDNQLFWAQPRRKPRTRVGSTKSNLNIAPVIRERSTEEPTCISNCVPKTDGIDIKAGSTGGNVETWQLDDAVRFPAMPPQPEFLVDSVGK